MLVAEPKATKQLLESLIPARMRVICCKVQIERWLSVRCELPSSGAPLVWRKLPWRSRRRFGGGSSLKVKIDWITKCVGGE